MVPLNETPAKVMIIFNKNAYKVNHCLFIIII